jgi:hypothetical protein
MSGWAPPPDNNGDDMADTGNGTVTLAVLGIKLDNLTMQVEAWRTDQEARLRHCERWCTTSEERWAAHSETHKTERGIIAGVGTLATAIASAAGMFLGK